ncbi:uncharacterized protein LOC128193351 isoform X2 [Vigna angularis]|uniref:uncharacterized protein LOC128193351 isoform X2 n=1 Tax=Phaseolus angularis TaxID=3914 RepID=UPI0022B4F7E0|nr:uncharacterized protein LOC128193351 isoform X2 [Vigna angularis]
MNCSQSVVSCLVSVAELVPRTNITGLQAPLGLFQLPIMQDWCFRYGCGSVKDKRLCGMTFTLFFNPACEGRYNNLLAYGARISKFKHVELSVTL